MNTGQYSRFFCRASQLGALMTGSATDGVISSTASKVLLDDIFLKGYGYSRQIDAKMINKGNEMEAEAIRLVSLLNGYGLNLSKNTERRKNRWFTGECDISTPDATRDTKCSWSAHTFPWTQEDAEAMIKKSGYDWQAQVYMMLYGKKKHYVDFTLFPTPYENLGYKDDEYYHRDFVEMIPIEKRITSFLIEYDENLIEKAKKRVDDVQNKYLTLWERIVNKVD